MYCKCKVGVTYNRTKVLFAIIHETSKFQGNNFIRSWLFLGSYRLAHMWHDFGGVWVHCALHRIPVLGWLLQQPHIRSDDIEEKGTGRIFYSEGELNVGRSRLLLTSTFFL
ncbi:uncharacterized protein LOC115720968 isoform X1 [Cannabis sativa]|uniref:uncharacterized protein LOC115720968 isoform X1 n=1 Tax=Cannabis sativa TaxID=3483 RepID=UPI0011DF8A31|nr:uncharacterized protein LOC115720968 isoform X1 [Cannabis sativa]